MKGEDLGSTCRIQAIILNRVAFNSRWYEKKQATNRFTKVNKVFLSIMETFYFKINVDIICYNKNVHDERLEIV